MKGQLTVLLVLAACSLPALGQPRSGTSEVEPPRLSGGSSSRGGGGMAPAVSAPSGGSTRSVSGTGVSGGTSMSRSSVGGNYRSYGGSYGGSSYGGRLYTDRSSFTSIGCYYQWQNFLTTLSRRYYLNGFSLRRFYVNSEPLVTPGLVRAGLRDPIRWSSDMLTAIDDLEGLVAARQRGDEIPNDSIVGKAKEIRKLAKSIRNDRAIQFFDQRENQDLNKGKRLEKLGLEGLGELREIALDMNIQLRNMFRQRTTSTVSVQSLSQPSFKSLSKAIDKLSKTVEKSAKRL